MLLALCVLHQERVNNCVQHQDVQELKRIGQQMIGKLEQSSNNDRKLLETVVPPE